jgi:hypothetical protein
MALAQESSILVGLAVGSSAWLAHQIGLPSVADIRQSESGNQDIERTERTAAFVSAGLITGVALVAKDPGVFIIGGIMFVAINYWFKHANQVHPATGTILGDTKLSLVPGSISESPPSQDVIYVDESI